MRAKQINLRKISYIEARKCEPKFTETSNGDDIVLSYSRLCRKKRRDMKKRENKKEPHDAAATYI
jgi:hypothetical protein